MPFDENTKNEVDRYARADLDGDLRQHIEFFSFLSDNPDLQRRVGEEYFSARYIYKLLEGLRNIDEWARRAQVQLQVQQYASIYEACLHHLLFVTCRDRKEVMALTEVPTLKAWSVRQDLQRKLQEISVSLGRNVVAAVEATIHLEETKVRFDSKARAAVKIGMIDDNLGDELIDFYATRNMIHIHAELKRGADWNWELKYSGQAYWRLKKFKQQIEAWQKRDREVDAST
jgi:hypothetical protein